MTYSGLLEEECRLKKLPCLKAYVVWDIKAKGWFFPRVYEDSPDDHCVLLRGLWATEEMAEKDIDIKDYAIVSIDMSDKIPVDIRRILSMNDTTISELEGLVLSKFRQLVTMFVFRSDKMKEQMERLYNE